MNSHTYSELMSCSCQQTATSFALFHPAHCPQEDLRARRRPHFKQALRVPLVERVESWHDGSRPGESKMSGGELNLVSYLPYTGY